METLIDHVLLDFGKALGLDGLKLDDDDHCCLKFDDLEVHIQATKENSQVMLSEWERMTGTRTHVQFTRSSGRCMILRPSFCIFISSEV